MRPEALIDGVVKALKILDEKAARMKREKYRSLTSREYAEKLAQGQTDDAEGMEDA